MMMRHEVNRSCQKRMDGFWVAALLFISPRCMSFASHWATLPCQQCMLSFRGRPRAFKESRSQCFQTAEKSQAIIDTKAGQIVSELQVYSFFFSCHFLGGIIIISISLGGIFIGYNSAVPCSFIACDRTKKIILGESSFTSTGLEWMDPKARDMVGAMAVASHHHRRHSHSVSSFSLSMAQLSQFLFLLLS